MAPAALGGPGVWAAAWRETRGPANAEWDACPVASRRLDGVSAPIALDPRHELVWGGGVADFW